MGTDGEDPADDPIARARLIGELDPPPDGVTGSQLFDPSARTIGGRRLTDAEASILLACTVDDMLAAADGKNATAAVLRELADVTNELADLIRPFAPGTFDDILARMPVAERRRARELDIKRRHLGGQ